MTVEQALKQGALADSERMLELFTEVGRSTPPESLLSAIIDTLFHRYYGMEALALASIVERDKFSDKIVGLPTLPEVAESGEQKMAIARIWLRQWQKNGFLLNGMPQAWRQIRIKPHTGTFAGMRSVLPTKPARTEFDKNWLPKLREWFCNPIPGGRFWLNGGNLTLAIGGEWAYCVTCQTAQRPFPQRTFCINCSRDTVHIIDPNSDPVFLRSQRVLPVDDGGRNV